MNRTTSWVYGLFFAFINIAQLSLIAHHWDESIPTSLTSPVGNMGLRGMKKCPYSHTWYRTMNSAEISWSSAHKLTMMREESELGLL